MNSSPPLALPALRAHPDLGQALASGAHDAVLVVGPAPLSRHVPAGPLTEALARIERVDAVLLTERPAVVCAAAANVPGERLVAATIGDWSTWEQDVRLYANAAAAAALRAYQAGARQPLLVVVGVQDERYARAVEVALLGALAAQWEPLELRIGGDRPLRATSLGVVSPSIDLARIQALELGRVVARDIGGTDPETMAPEGVASYCERVFAGSAVKVTVERDQDAIARGYPLIAAVARASQPVERHRPRIVRLEYVPEGPVERTLLLAGKGLTYDTGGADLKVDGSMSGMSRDKGGAAAVAGVLKVCAERRPRGVRVIGLLGAVRNDIGPDSFVTDEIIRSRSGLRVRIGNTDAEGRLVLAELLAELREEAERAPSPALFSVATLTGHAAVAHGPYTAFVPNGRVRAGDLVSLMQIAGDAIGDPTERSSLRPEDYAFIAPRSAAEDVLSCNTLASSRTPRGHQFPAAFLDVVSGLRAIDRRAGLPFIHVDIAGSTVTGGGWAHGVPTGAPVLAMSEGLGLVLTGPPTEADLAAGGRFRRAARARSSTR